jgi:hypothetical protein
MYKSKSILIIGFIALLSNCATVKAPSGSVPTRTEITTDAFGGWISASLKSRQEAIQGEFIAVSTDSIYILTGNKAQGYALTSVDKARIVMFNTNTALYIFWTVGGSLATLSNGDFLVFTLPLTLVTGIVTTSAEAHRINFYDYPQFTWEELKKYARFPQGLPEKISITDIKSRPMR